jgi:hypothetical protein
MAEANMGEAKRRFRAAAEAAVRAVGEDLLGEAQRRAPVEEGTLRASGDLEVKHLPGNLIVAEVSFNEVYAARQHEELGYEHPKGGQARYLQSVIQERGARYAGIFAKALERAL